MGSYALEFANPQHLIRQATGFLNECGFLRIPFGKVAKNSFFCDRNIQNQVTMANYINPFTDIGFKRIFGQELSKPLRDRSQHESGCYIFTHRLFQGKLIDYPVIVIRNTFDSVYLLMMLSHSPDLPLILVDDKKQDHAVKHLNFS